MAGIGRAAGLTATWLRCGFIKHTMRKQHEKFHGCKLSVRTCLLCPFQHGMFECPRISPKCFNEKNCRKSALRFSCFNPRALKYVVNSSFSSSCQRFFRVATCSKYNESSDCCSPVIYKSSTFPLGLIPRVVFICGRQLKESSRSTTCIKLSTNCIKLSYLIIQSYHPVYLIKTTIPSNMSYTGDNTIYNSTILFYGDNMR